MTLRLHIHPGLGVIRSTGPSSSLSLLAVRPQCEIHDRASVILAFAPDPTGRYHRSISGAFHVPGRVSEVIVGDHMLHECIDVHPFGIAVFTATKPRTDRLTLYEEETTRDRALSARASGM